MPIIEYKALLFEELKDLDFAAEYLASAVEEGDQVFLLAVRDVVEAQGGVGALSKTTKLNRENLYSMLSKRGNPRLSSITTILDKLGFELTIRRRTKKNKGIRKPTSKAA